MINIDILTLLIFVLILSLVLYRNRKKAELQKIIFPALYMVVFRTKFGLKFVDRFTKKHSELIKFLGYSCIGISVIGLLYISYSILSTMLRFFLAPAVTDTGVQLVLPGSTIPGIGYLSFWHWLISLFILVIVHEFSHAVVARAHGLKIKSSGFAVLGIFFPIFPAAFVEPDEKSMAKREDPVQYSIFSAGPISNLFLALVFGIMLFAVFAPLSERFYNIDGIEIISVNETGPAYAAGIRNGTVINFVNGRQVDDIAGFINTFEYCVSPGDNVSLANRTHEFVVVPSHNPVNPEKPLIGVNLRTNLSIKEDSKWYFGVFNWFKDLFMWLFLLNLFIGLANLLPIFVTDGAQMLRLMLSRFIKDQKRAIRVWKWINALFLILLMIGLLATYIKQIVGAII